MELGFFNFELITVQITKMEHEHDNVINCQGCIILAVSLLLFVF